MSSTRYSQQPLQIYQDPVSSYDRAPMPSEQSHTKRLSPLRPVKNAVSRKNHIFNPPQAGQSRQSPHKSMHQNSSSPLRAPLNNNLNMISMPAPRGPVYNTDSIEKKQPMMSKFKPQKAMFAAFNSSSMEKENYPQQQSSYYHAPIAPYHGGNFSLEGLFPAQTTQPAKRRLMDAAPIHESRPFKKTKMEEERHGEETMDFTELPTPESFSTIHDDGNKPTHSYATLIGMAILRAPNRRLTLAQIYKWISDTYRFYSATDAGWQNSIRHNLSLNKAFIKQERPKDDPGKGNYWAIQPGMEHQFIKDKLVRKGGPNETVPFLNQTPLDQANEPRFKALVPAPPPELPQQPRQPLPEARLPDPPVSTPAPGNDISSDATIPNSDAVLTDPDLLEEDTHEPEPSSPLIPSSPPMAMMHSSPPIPREATKRNNTPPPVPRFDGSSRSRSHKRKYAQMDDSGYFSSLDSSAIRPNRLLSDIDRPRIKRGRAEEEIARLRGSSYDSPTKNRSPFLHIQSSSPVRRILKNDNTLMGPPTTPAALKLKPPVRPPPSVSPNTHLRAHRDRVREMVGSPLRGMVSLEENQPYSPAFQILEDSSYFFHDFNADFDVFTDSAGMLAVPGNGSPEKRSAKRPRLDRSRSANILSDISHTPFGQRLSTAPLLQYKHNLNGPSTFVSPIKGLGLIESPIKGNGLIRTCFPDSPTKYADPTFSIPHFEIPTNDEFFGAEFLSEDVSEGWDIMQGFQKIGSGVAKTPKQSASSSRPALGRSLSNWA